MENKEGRVNYKFISSGLIFTILMALLVIGLVEFTDSVVRAPTDNYINLSRSINFTFNSTWTAAGGEIGNCSLWTDFTGTWAETAVNNSASANIMNGTTGMSNINYTFTGDATSMSWAIACRNGSSGDALNVTSSETWTLTIDTLTPKVNQTDAFFSGFNTSSLLPSITFYLNDINGSGINLTATAGAEQANETLNVTIYNYEAAGGSAIAGNFTLANSSFLSCTPTGGAVTETTCTLDLTNLPLTDGSKNISIAVSDRAGRVNLTSFLFTVDTLAPALTQLNITNASQFAGANVMDVRNGTGWIIQGATIYLTTNLTDNLTQPLNISFQFLNGSTWQVGDIQKTVDASDGAYSAAEGMWGNASYTIPTGHNIFEGRNVSFRAVYNDTLGNSNTSETLIVQVNDTTKPTVSINGTFAVNGTNITDTTPRISWAVVEGNPMASINISVDGTVTDSDGVDGCGKSAWYDTSIGDKNVELFRNGSFPISEAGACSGLTNGSHYIRVIAIDVWGNSETVFNNFTVQTGTPTISLSSLENGLSAVNGSNVTVATGINFTAVGGATTSILETFSWTSSCNTSTQTISASVSDFTAANLSFIYPFQNITSCANGEASRTVTITVADSAGNSKTEQYTFLVDGVGPSLTVTSPTDGSSSANNVSIILTGTDGTQKLSSFGYYLDAGILSGTFNSLNLSSSIGEAATSTTNTFSRNFTAGRHTIKFTVNDTLGNVVNGTDYTITVLGPLDFTALGFNSTDGANTTLAAYNINMSRVVLSNSSGDAMGDSIRTVTDQTLNLFMALNGTAKGVNVTIYFNASAANWDRYNFSIVQNHSTSMGHIENNWTATILDYIYINDSLSNFIPAASYYGKVRIPINASNVSGSSYTLGNVFEIWYFADETDLTTRTNDVEECEASFIPTNDLTPCWNNTNDLFVEVFVPSFSIVALVNSSGSSPSITVNTPSGNQTVSHFIPSITVSADATN
ncbi:hypothetical protein ISS05_03265, partial [Candidatus Woesearchaeota archaeon]|nr:hypothetical protein [Candidatus Woesearchaeota archaeon]